MMGRCADTIFHSVSNRVKLETQRIGRGRLRRFISDEILNHANAGFDT